MTPAPAAGLDLRDIHAAAPAEFWPPAPGWWLLAALLAVAIAYTTMMLIRGYRRHRQKQHILLGLAQLEKSALHADAAQFTAALSALLRRVALMRYARTDVASLTGTAWLQFLDDTGGGGAFINGPGRVLATAPYASRPPAPSRDALLALARAWVKRNLEERR